MLHDYLAEFSIDQPRIHFVFINVVLFIVGN